MGIRVYADESQMERFVSSMGFTFFCTDMEKVLYNFSETKVCSTDLSQRCNQAISEILSLFTCKRTKLGLFDSNYNLEILNDFLIERGQDYEPGIRELLGDLKYIISQNPINKRINRAKQLQLFFEGLGDDSFYATKDCLYD